MQPLERTRANTLHAVECLQRLAPAGRIHDAIDAQVPHQLVRQVHGGVAHGREPIRDQGYLVADHPRARQAPVRLQQRDLGGYVGGANDIDAHRARHGGIQSSLHGSHQVHHLIHRHRCGVRQVAPAVRLRHGGTVRHPNRPAPHQRTMGEQRQGIPRQLAPHTLGDRDNLGPDLSGIERHLFQRVRWVSFALVKVGLLAPERERNLLHAGALIQLAGNLLDGVAQDLVIGHPERMRSDGYGAHETHRDCRAHLGQLAGGLQDCGPVLSAQQAVRVEHPRAGGLVGTKQYPHQGVVALVCPVDAPIAHVHHHVDVGGIFVQLCRIEPRLIFGRSRNLECNGHQVARAAVQLHVVGGEVICLLGARPAGGMHESRRPGHAVQPLARRLLQEFFGGQFHPAIPPKRGGRRRTILAPAHQLLTLESGSRAIHAVRQCVHPFPHGGGLGQPDVDALREFRGLFVPVPLLYRLRPGERPHQPHDRLFIARSHDVAETLSDDLAAPAIRRNALQHAQEAPGRRQAPLVDRGLPESLRNRLRSAQQQRGGNLVTRSVIVDCAAIR